jgi:hypothetical protein
MTRFEVKMAWVMGIALPVLETARRKTNFHPIAFYLDDFIAGGLLLWAAYASERKRSYGPGLLSASWGIVCGGFYYSFFGQLQNAQGDISGVANVYVVLIKGLLFAAAIVALVLSLRNTSRSRQKRT